MHLAVHAVHLLLDPRAHRALPGVHCSKAPYCGDCNGYGHLLDNDLRLFGGCLQVGRIPRTYRRLSSELTAPPSSFPSDSDPGIAYKVVEQRMVSSSIDALEAGLEGIKRKECGQCDVSESRRSSFPP